MKITAAKSRGIDVISFAVGDPVESTPAPIIEELREQAGKVENHCYPPGEAQGMKQFRSAVADWY